MRAWGKGSTGHLSADGALFCARCRGVGPRRGVGWRCRIEGYTGVNSACLGRRVIGKVEIELDTDFTYPENVVAEKRIPIRSGITGVEGDICVAAIAFAALSVPGFWTLESSISLSFAPWIIHLRRTCRKRRAPDHPPSHRADELGTPRQPTGRGSRFKSCPR